MKRSLVIRIISGLAAAGLVLYGASLPLWTMTMRAPQYPKGLRLSAYGTGMTGDLSELTILNHYIGMPPIQAPAFETTLFPYGVGTLVILCLLSPLHRRLRQLALIAASAAPVAILADLQWQLYVFGHSLNPKAAIRLEPFTPLVIGPTQMGNFKSWAMVSWGFGCFAGAAIVIASVGFLTRRLERRRTPASVKQIAVAAAGVACLLAMDARPAATSMHLQALLDAAPRGTTVTVPPGLYAGPVVIRGPLTVIAPQGATIDGGAAGSVVTIEGRDVQFQGFVVRNSGRDVTEEAAGIKISGDGHLIEANRVEDVYFGIHVGNGSRVVVRDNTIAPGERHGARPGHGISAWHVRDSVLSRNRISHARDGVYLSFTERVVVTGNTVTDCRYGFHSMYSQDARFEDNEATANLLGAALMMSDRLVLRRNRVANHREGAAAYGVLLKDVGELLAEGNLILSNRVGVYAEAVPTDPSRQAVLAGNVIAGNEVGLALQSTAALTVAGNRIADNLTDVRPLGRQLSAGMQWTREGRGNFWGRYRGYDANRDGIGDVPFELDDAMDGLLRRNRSIQAFLYTPAHAAVEAAARMFPIYRQPPILIDARPLMAAASGVTR